MSETAKEETPETPPPVQRRSLGKRAYRIRKIPEKDRTDEQRAYLANWDATKRNAGPAKVEPEIEEPDEPEPTTAASEVIPDIPVPPTPPRVSVPGGNDSAGGNDRGGSSGADWRSRYTRGKSADGRETTVLTIASQYMHILQWMESQIVFSGGKPLIPSESIWNALVITVDDVLPRDITLKPQHMVIACTTTLVVQRFARRKEVAEAYANAARSGEPIPVVPPPPPPPPPPPGPDRPVEAAVVTPPIQIRPDAMADDMPNNTVY